jgi:hypothetical protein
MQALPKLNEVNSMKSRDPKFLIKDGYYKLLPDDTLAWFDNNFTKIKENEHIYLRKGREHEYSVEELCGE